MLEINCSVSYWKYTQKPCHGLITASCLSEVEPQWELCLTKYVTRKETGWYLDPKSIIVFKHFSRLQTNKSNGCNWEVTVGALDPVSLLERLNYTSLRMQGLLTLS